MLLQFPQFPGTTASAFTGTKPPEGPHARINPNALVGLEQLRYAVYRALCAERDGKLRSSGIHSEILVALSGSNNIRDALSRFGHTEGESLFVQVTHGEAGNGRVDESQLTFSPDNDILRAVYGSSNPEAIIGAMALRGI